MKKIKIEYACQSCKATGLYVGMAESDGAAVVCSTCSGTGKAVHRFEYEDFTGRKLRRDVKRVYEVNPGIGIGIGSGHQLPDFGGMPYAEWSNGKSFTPGMENRKFTCPAWWYQTADSKLKPEWKECRWGQRFSHCLHFTQKEKCWERWDKEFGKNSRKEKA